MSEGDTLQVKYVLTNETNQSINDCADGWDNFILIGTKATLGKTHSSVGAASIKDAFTLPPKGTLTWTVSIVVPAVGKGPAQLFGTFGLRCGSLKPLDSAPAPIRID